MPAKAAELHWSIINLESLKILIIYLLLLAVQIDDLISTIRDQNLKLTLSFGVGLHHAGLQERDRKIAEKLFVNQKIQVPSGHY